MRSLSKVALLIAALSLVAMFAVQPAPVQAQSNKGLITCINKTSEPLTFSVDGDEETCRATKNRECFITYEVGKHSLYAENDNGVMRARKSIDLTSSGFTWTIN